MLQPFGDQPRLAHMRQTLHTFTSVTLLILQWHSQPVQRDLVQVDLRSLGLGRGRGRGRGDPQERVPADLQARGLAGFSSPPVVAEVVVVQSRGQVDPPHRWSRRRHGACSPCVCGGLAILFHELLRQRQ